LGKGLGALIPEKGIPEGEGKKALQQCGIEEVQPNPFQPRKAFSDEQLQELVDSIREKGILQPLLVRRKSDGYELIAGERRWRAAQRAGLREIPILVRDVSDSEMLEISLIENIQRENLNPIEEAEAYKRLMEQFHLTQEEISKKVGKDRTTIANMVRLLRLPPEIKLSLAEARSPWAMRELSSASTESINRSSYGRGYSRVACRSARPKVWSKGSGPEVPPLPGGPIRNGAR
jgi:ParB family chromosome partitioning protein